MKVRLAQINPIVGNLEYNTGLIKDIISSSREFDIIVFPELSLTGYPPQDLLLDKKFILETQEALADIKNIVEQQVVIIGLPVFVNDSLMNSAAVMQNKEIMITSIWKFLI